MRKKNKFHNQKNDQRKIGGKIISESAFEAPEVTGSTDHLPPVFSFKDTCPNHYQLQDWQGTELKHLNQALRDFGNRTWAEVRRIKGFKPVNQSTFSKELPEYISPEVTIWECRISGRARLFGYRARNVFHIIWFDRNHEVYSMS